MKTEKVKKKEKTPFNDVTSADIAYSVHHKALSNFPVDSMCLEHHIHNNSWSK